MLSDKKVSIPHELEVCQNCNASRMSRVDATVNGWLPMSRREQRRARKAAKNLHMWKTFGDRPWGSLKEWLTLTHPDGISANGDYRVTDIHSIRMQDFREPSGFVAMSQYATQIERGFRSPVFGLDDDGQLHELIITEPMRNGVIFVDKFAKEEE